MRKQPFSMHPLLSQEGCRADRPAEGYRGRGAPCFVVPSSCTRIQVLWRSCALSRTGCRGDAPAAEPPASPFRKQRADTTSLINHALSRTGCRGDAPAEESPASWFCKLHADSTSLINFVLSRTGSRADGPCGCRGDGPGYRVPA